MRRFKILYDIHIFFLGVVLSGVLMGCGERKQAPKSQPIPFDSLVNVVWFSQDLHVLQMVDSLEATGDLSASRADFLRGMAYDRNRQIMLGHHYYEKVYQTVDPEKEGWGFYLVVANRLSELRMTTSDYKGALEVATTTMEKAEKAGVLSEKIKVGFLCIIAYCQDHLGLDEGRQTGMEAYEMLKQCAEEDVIMRTNLAIFLSNMCGMATTAEDYDEANVWYQRFVEALDGMADSDPLTYQELALDVPILKIDILSGEGKTAEADSIFEAWLPKFLDVSELLPEQMVYAAEYLLDRERFAEAADFYDRIDTILPEDHRFSEMTLDNIGLTLIPRLQANLGAKRNDAALAIARTIADNYSDALKEYKESNAAELATIYDTQGKERQIAEQQLSISRQQKLGFLIALVLVSAFFIIYTWYRRRAEKRLGTAHAQLQQAYDQLEETTAAKERIESELRIARDIQMSMVPNVFPQHEGLDMFAEMSPAKEVGGDLYGYVLKGDTLYFCVGDVSGKGVPASLFMAQSARLFRTLAIEGMMPADIALRMNNELAENNDRGMFVTMFIGMADLKTGRLDFCNCGHNPPLLDGQFLKMEYDNQPLGLWEDDPFYGETIEDIRDRQLLIYTDGLNEAENPKQELFGNQRLVELMTGKQGLSSKEMIALLQNAVEQHREGAVPNDDLTLMCLKLTKL